MKVQIIEKNGKPEWAVIPYMEYRRLSEAAEMAEDVRDFDEAVSRDEETVPHAIVQRLVRGEQPVKVWREYRGLAQDGLSPRPLISLPLICPKLKPAPAKEVCESSPPSPGRFR